MRKKVVSRPVFASWGEVNDAMRLIGEYECQLDEIRIEMNRQQALAKEVADELAQPIQQKIGSLEESIAEFVSQNRSELDGKTKQLNFGSTGFRLSTKLMTPKPADIIASLKRHQMDDCVNVKETINKDVLKRYPTEDILKVGAYLKADDEFWYDVNRDKLQPVE